jgi:hypothetical protein
MPIRTGRLTILAITETSLEFNPTQVPHPEHLLVTTCIEGYTLSGPVVNIYYICLRENAGQPSAPHQHRAGTGPEGNLTLQAFPCALEIALFLGGFICHAE